MVDAKLRNIAKIESALDTFGRSLRLIRASKSGSIISELDSESLPWFDEVLCGDRRSFVQGDGGTELARCGISIGRLNALSLCVPCNLTLMFLNFCYLIVSG